MTLGMNITPHHHHALSHQHPAGFCRGRSRLWAAGLLLWLGVILYGQPAAADKPLPNTDLDDLQVSPTRIPPGPPVKVTVSIRPQVHIGTPTSISLYRTDAKRKLLVGSPLATFNDNGDLGDETPGDGLFTTQVMLGAERPGEIIIVAVGTFIMADPSDEDTISSSPLKIKVVPGASTKGPFVVVDEEKRAIFRDRDGWPMHKLPDQALKNGKAPAEAPGPDGLVFTQEVAIASPDRSHVAVTGPLHKAAVRPEDEPPAGWEFRYYDFSGLLWKRRITEPFRHFYTYGDSGLISEDGDRVVVLAVGTENNDDPYLWVYNKSGKVLLEEEAPLAAISNFRISENGRYLAFKGLPSRPSGDLATPQEEGPSPPSRDLHALLVIDVDHPQKRWTHLYHGSKTGPTGYYPNAAGGFDVTFSDGTRHSFPR